jgi:hypothetical protein
MLLTQLAAPNELHLSVDTFREILVLSLFEDRDNLRHRIPAALSVLSSHQELNPRFVRPKNAKEFVDAVNNFDGNVMIVDGHGMHAADSEEGCLIVGSSRISISELTKDLRVPLIVVLSACDTHPFDRTYNTVASGFLLSGAMSVLSTALPIRGRDAAAFIIRLFLRAIQYGSLMVDRGISVPWSNVIGGAFRMHLAHTVARRLSELDLASQSQAEELHLNANLDINQPNEHWFERFAENCRRVTCVFR